MDTKCQTSKRGHERGATALQIVVILVPVVFGLIGFAFDLGMLYVVKGELKSAANAMALAAAQKLIGTDAALDAANAAAQITVQNGVGTGNRYDFNGLPIGQSTGNLVSTASDPSYFGAAADALAASASSGAGTAGGAQAKYAVATVTGQIPLIFWSFLPIVSNRNVTVAVNAVAGISAPLCTACNIEPLAVAALDSTDTTNFGFTLNELYSFTYLCTGTPTPSILPGATQVLNYILLNRFDTATTVLSDESSQAFRDAAGGLPGTNTSTQSCFTVGNTELVWVSAAPVACNLNAPPATATDALCGLDSRFENITATACQGIAAIDTLSTIYQPDTDTATYDTYTDYAGDGRRIITIPIVDVLSATGSMTVLGFRQFLLIPNQGTAALNPADTAARFIGMYIGSVAPVAQGRFDGCSQTAGPGKVVLHQ